MLLPHEAQSCPSYTNITYLVSSALISWSQLRYEFIVSVHSVHLDTTLTILKLQSKDVTYDIVTVSEKCRLMGCDAVWLYLQQLMLLRSEFQLSVTANVVPSWQILSTPMMERIRTSETSVVTRATRRHIPEHGILHSQSAWKLLISHNLFRSSQEQSAHYSDFQGPRFGCPRSAKFYLTHPHKMNIVWQCLTLR
jgi:hypothetical protein